MIINMSFISKYTSYEHILFFVFFAPNKNQPNVELNLSTELTPRQTAIIRNAILNEHTNSSNGKLYSEKIVKALRICIGIKK